MKLEDALLFIALDSSVPVTSAVAMETLCRDLAAGGVDAIQVGGSNPDCVQAAVDACHGEACLCLVGGAAEVAENAGADGVHLEDMGETTLARVVLSGDKLVGMTAKTRDEVLLGFEIGVDYIVYDGDAGHGAVMSGLRESAAVPVYAGGIRDVEAAREIVEAGIFRLCVTVLPDGDVTEQVAAYARLLGRSV